MYEKYIKRMLDIIISLFVIIAFFPLYVILGILVKIKLGSPVIFIQPRPGKNEEIFKLYKFRTMTNQKDNNGNILSDEMRLTEFGRWLRSTSLDEIPEFINILEGKMSLVGPRPQLIKDLVFMSSEQRKRHCVRPGLTGLAQINGRNSISWEEKFKYDLKYIEKITFFRDFEIVLKTIMKVLRKEDISQKETHTSGDFGDYLLRKKLISKQLYDAKIKESKRYRL